MNRRLFSLISALYLLLLVVVLPYAGSTPRSVDARRGVSQATLLTVQEQPSDDPVPQPEPVNPNVVFNVTQEEHENALARWRSHGVVEYELTVIDASYMTMGGKAQLHFKVEQGAPTLVSYTDLGGEQPRLIPLATLSSEEMEFWRIRSVEGMLEFIGVLLTEEPAYARLYGNDFDIAFHPTLGYTLYLDAYAVLPQGGRATDCCLHYQVLDLRIIKHTTTPGMPDTGGLDL
ncbi:MAG: hypothetical protein M3441_03595 [Chloroflexota bacterium]|nr:hypothetical protein [Chloroflexota bacterium]